MEGVHLAHNVTSETPSLSPTRLGSPASSGGGTTRCSSRHGPTPINSSTSAAAWSGALPAWRGHPPTHAGGGRAPAHRGLNSVGLKRAGFSAGGAGRPSGPSIESFTAGTAASRFPGGSEERRDAFIGGPKRHRLLRGAAVASRSGDTRGLSQIVRRTRSPESLQVGARAWILDRVPNEEVLQHGKVTEAIAQTGESSALISDYYTLGPDPGPPVPAGRRSSTSGHRGSSGFTLPTRPTSWPSPGPWPSTAGGRHPGPLYIGADTALSEPAHHLRGGSWRRTAWTSCCRRRFDADAVISRASWRTTRVGAAVADGLVITPIRNPLRRTAAAQARPPSRGPRPRSHVADPAARQQVIRRESAPSRRVPFERAVKLERRTSRTTSCPTFGLSPQSLDMEAIARSGLHVGVDPLGRAGISTGTPSSRSASSLGSSTGPDRHALCFMPLDHDG